MKINLGCGSKPMKGWVNCDKYQHQKGVMRVDLDKDWPWPDSSAELMSADNVLEHLADFEHTFNEIYRVLQHGGEMHIVAPHGQGWGALYPGHKLFFNWWTFKGLCNPEWETWKFELVDYTVRFFNFWTPLDWFGSKFPRFCDQFVSIKPVTILAVLRKV